MVKDKLAISLYDTSFDKTKSVVAVTLLVMDSGVAQNGSALRLCVLRVGGGIDDVTTSEARRQKGVLKVSTQPRA